MFKPRRKKDVKKQLEKTKLTKLIYKPFKTKKAQITAFMIIGIILLFSSALVFYIRGQITEGISEDFIPSIEEVPLQAQPIKVFVEDCMKQTAIDALKKIGNQGGYIDPLDFEMSGKSLTKGIEPTESDMLAFIEGNDQTNMPYWWYLSSSNLCGKNGQPCQYDSNRPYLYKAGGMNSIEAQLDKYIQREVQKCINNFNDFKIQGFSVEEKGDFTVDAKVAEKEVIVLLNYPISVSKDTAKVDIDQFFTKVNINFKTIYTLAELLTKIEGRYSLLEQNLMDAIMLYSIPVGIDKLPPLAHHTLDPSEFYIWMRTDTQKKIESDVLVNIIPAMAVQGSKDYAKLVIFSGGKVNDVASGIMAGFVWHVDEINYTTFDIEDDFNFDNVEVSFTYSDWWPIYLNINDREILKGDSFKNDFFPFISMTSYVFAYDVSFPVVITLKDPYAFEGKGYTFNFAMEGNLRGNEPLLPDLTISKGADPTRDSLACNENQRNSAPIKVISKDAITKEPVPGALVEFMLGSQACFLGKTAVDENSESSFTTQFSVGIGRLKITKKGYLQYNQRFTPVGGEDTLEKEVLLYPEVNINATIRGVGLIWDTTTKDYVLPSGSADVALLPFEESFITFKRINAEGEDFDYTTTLSFKGDQRGPTLFKIVPGMYELTGSVMAYKELIIPYEEKTYEIPFSDDRVAKANETIMDSYLSGGININNVTGYVNISEEDLLNSRQVIFYMVRMPDPETHSIEFKNKPSLEGLGRIPEFSNIYREEFNPVWLR